MITFPYIILSISNYNCWIKRKITRFYLCFLYVPKQLKVYTIPVFGLEPLLCTLMWERIWRWKWQYDQWEKKRRPSWLNFGFISTVGMDPTVVGRWRILPNPACLREASRIHETLSPAHSLFLFIYFWCQKPVSNQSCFPWTQVVNVIWVHPFIVLLTRYLKRQQQNAVEKHSHDEM